MSRSIDKFYVIRNQEGKALQLSTGASSWLYKNKAKLALRDEVSKNVTVRYSEENVDIVIKLDWIVKLNGVFYILYKGQKLQFNNLLDIIEMYLKDGVYSIEEIKL